MNTRVVALFLTGCAPKPVRRWLNGFGTYAEIFNHPAVMAIPSMDSRVQNASIDEQQEIRTECQFMIDSGKLETVW